MTEYCATCRKPFDIREGINCYDCQLRLIETGTEKALRGIRDDETIEKFKRHIRIMRDRHRENP